MHLRVILPVIGDGFIEHVRTEVEAWALPTTTVSVVSLARGTASIESEYDEALSAPGILDRIEECAVDGVDGVFITCFGDPGVHAAREIIDAPVVGGFEPAVLTALSLGEKVGIITVLPNVLPMIRGLARRYDVDNRIGTIRVVDIPVLGLDGDDGILLDRLEEQAVSAIEAGEADVIILGCTGMLGVADALKARLAGRGFVVPVVDPTAAAVTWIESSVRMGLTPSRLTYMAPPAKARNL
ncbi:aspartate/glutamate racemase family protein [Microbacterium sp. ASV49]|uniref:Aspartate/glutamate racemase family protein n=1 Tax=Microbacterium candidum TaxID=3041922 RepID=A0ABT7MW39_9MICO|nr:aspartate/glutamate racemase family protein [Microbacterium sp. ASV49]MDL9978666.1 aspartate/glutamate racemase family protein [Microbacterium sp. ASV49]